MEHIETSIAIDAPAARVWEILTDFPAYPAWNPFVRAISGNPVVGSRLSITVQPDGGKAMSFHPQLLRFQENAELRWRGRVLLPGLFDGEHYFQLTEHSPGQVRLVHGETFSGILVPLFFRGPMKDGTRRGFEALNRALKQRAEATTP